MSTNINEGAENVNINSASAQTDGIFVPSKEWQDVPDWADPLPPCGEYRTSFNTNRRQARWDNPPGAETVFDKRAGKLQTAGASQKAEQNGDTDGAGTGVRILRIPNHATSRSTAANKVILFFADEKTFTVSDLMSFDRDKDPSNMIGKRWLCKGDSLLIAGPTGIGKSSFIMAMVVNWSLGLDLFGIKPVNALRCLIIQAENNQGDLAIAFQDLLKSQKLSAEQMKQLGENLVFQQVSSKAGTAFVEYAKAQIAKHKPDVIIADPLFSYAGGDVSKQAEMSPFLRNQIQPILNETGVIWAFVHHTGKPPRDGQQSNRRALYDSLGSTDLTNWAREIISIRYEDWDERIFKVEFGKRARQANLVDGSGRPVYDLFLKHSKNGVVWEEAERTEAKAATDKNAKAAQAKIEWVRNFIMDHETVTIEQLQMYGPQNDVGKNAVVGIARALAQNKDASPRIYEYKIEGETKKLVVFSTVPESDRTGPEKPSKPKKKTEKKTEAANATAS